MLVSAEQSTVKRVYGNHNECRLQHTENSLHPFLLNHFGTTCSAVWHEKCMVTTLTTASREKPAPIPSPLSHCLFSSPLRRECMVTTLTTANREKPDPFLLHSLFSSLEWRDYKVTTLTTADREKPDPFLLHHFGTPC